MNKNNEHDPLLEQPQNDELIPPVRNEIIESSRPGELPAADLNEAQEINPDPANTTKPKELLLPEDIEVSGTIEVEIGTDTPSPSVNQDNAGILLVLDNVNDLNEIFLRAGADRNSEIIGTTNVISFLNNYAKSEFPVEAAIAIEPPAPKEEPKTPREIIKALEKSSDGPFRILLGGFLSKMSEVGL